MKNIYITITLLIISTVFFGQDAELQWATAFGSSNYDKGNAIVVDASGNVYTCGTFYDTVSFDPLAPNASLTSFGGADIFIMKQDQSGNFLWVKQIGGTSFESADAMAIDALGNLYLTGSFEGTTDFDPDVTLANKTASGASDIFILKLTSIGIYDWVFTTGSNNYDRGDAITVNASGDIFAVGHFYNLVDFDPSPIGVYTLSSNSSSFPDIYI